MDFLPAFRGSAMTLSIALSFSLLPATATAQQESDESPAPPVLEHAPMVYLDCRRCPETHLRTEIDFVNYVREASAAQVHIIITDQPTGGGQLYTMAFIGRNAFAGMDQTLTYSEPQNATDAQTRDGLTRIMRVGLVPYVARTQLVDRLRVSLTSEAGSAPAQVGADAWRNWTFEVYGGGNFNTESSQDSWSARYGFYANRVTPEWKVRLRPYFNHNSRTIRRTDQDDIHVRQRRHGWESYLIKSLGGHMGAGVFVDYLTADVDNMRHGVTITPAIEYSYYPYSEATRRSMTLTYRVGYEVNDYIEETIYEKTEESLANHSLNASVQFRQPWGSISSGITGFSYLHDSDFHRIAVNGNVSFRLGGGVSLNVGGNYQRINDQLNLPRRGASLEDVLLQRQRLATSYRGSGNIGLSYTFGSMFSNVVNPRL
ncbi:MAG TPA: hypothetical protein VK929_01200 [Longimicrobiales bacterium]|nr:hypothetical protein [Longimicrobiales bacterium]